MGMKTILEARNMLGLIGIVAIDVQVVCQKVFVICKGFIQEENLCDRGRGLDFLNRRWMPLDMSLLHATMGH